MRKLFIGFFFLLVFLGAILFRGLTVKSLQQSYPATESAAFADREEILDRLAKALKFKTISYENERIDSQKELVALHKFIDNSYPLVQTHLKKMIFSKYSLLYRWPGKNSCKPLLLMSHLDVVPIEGEGKDWTYPPFSGERHDGFVWGRGALDVKNGVFSLLEAAENLLSTEFQPMCDIYFAFGHDEEIGGYHGAKVMAEYFKTNNIQLGMVLDEGGIIGTNLINGLQKPTALVGLAEKGYLTVGLSVKADGGHSSMPPKQTSIGIMATALAKIEKNPRAAVLSPVTAETLDYLVAELPFVQTILMANRWLFRSVILGVFASTPTGNATIRTTAALTMIDGGFKQNVLAKRVDAKINFRIIPGDTVDEVVEWLKNLIEDDRVSLEVIQGWNPPAMSQASAPVFKDVLQKTIHQVYPDVLVVPNLSVVVTDSRHFADVADQIYRFNPMHLKKEDLKRIHGTDERISEDSYLQGLKFYRGLIENYQVDDVH